MADQNAKIDANSRASALGQDESSGELRRLQTDSNGVLKVIIDSLTASFLDLSDTPNSYSGQALKGVRVNAGETALEFYTTSAGVGDVVGPASSTDNAITRFDSTTGKLIQNSTVILDDSGNVTAIGNITGKSGGITLTGGTGSGDDIRITSTSNATKGTVNIGSTTSGVFLDETNSLFAIGTSSNTLPVFGASANVRMLIAKDSGANMGTFGSIAAGGNPEFYGMRVNGTLASPTIVANGDTLFDFGAFGYDGTTGRAAAMITFKVDGTPGASDMPGSITFSTTADGASSSTERVIIDSAGVMKPASNDGVALGTGALSYSDLFLASGGVINWNNGDVTITHAANSLAFAGASSGYTFDAIVSPASNDGAPLGSGATSWSDLFLASGGVINFNNGDVTITHSANALDIDGGVVDFGSTPTVNGAAIYFTGGTDVALADGGTGASLADPNADRIMFWDDSAGQVTWLTAGTGLTITDTTISASASSTERRHMCPNFVVANMSTSGTAPTNAVINNGVQCSVNSSGASSVASIQHGDAQWLDFYDKNPEFFIAAYYSAGISTGSGDVWAGDTGNTVPPTVTQTTKSMFLIIETTAGTPTWSAVNANGTTNTNTTLSGTPSNQTYTLRIVKNSTTNIKWYTDYTLKATHTTNLPSGDVVNDNIFSVGVKNDGGDGTTRTAIFGLGDIVIDAATG